jgi:hypothetical protein
VAFLVHDISRLNSFNSAARSFFLPKSVPRAAEVGKKVEEGMHYASMPHNCDVRTQVANGLD